MAVIGAGWVTTHRHIPSLRAQAEVELIGIIDRYEGRARAASQSCGVTRWAEKSRLSEVDWLNEVDAVTVGTSPFTHYALALEALQLGKHVLTEKPFTMAPSEGEHLLEVAAKARRTLAIVHNFQFARSCRMLRADIERGTLGKITSIEAMQLSNPRRRLPVWYEKLPGGLFYDESPHLLYLLRRLGGGEPKLVGACAQRDARSSPTPANLTAHYESPKGIPMRMSLNFVAPLSEWHVLVCGEERIGCIDIFRDIYICLPNDGLHVTPTVVRTSLLTFWQHWIGHFVPGFQHLTGSSMYGNIEVMRRFVLACLTGEPPEGIGATDALAVLRMQHDLLHAVGFG